MDITNDCVEHWHKTFERLNDNKGSKFVDAEVLRDRLFLLNIYDKTDEFDDLASKLHEDYGNLVDSRSGLNNYFDSLLADVSQIPNKCQSWKSNLTKDSCLRMPCVSKFLSQIQPSACNPDEQIKWVNSDSIENLSIAALKEVTTVTDATAKPQFGENSLSNLERKCYNDFDGYGGSHLISSNSNRISNFQQPVRPQQSNWSSSDRFSNYENETNNYRGQPDAKRSKFESRSSYPHYKHFGRNNTERDQNFNDNGDDYQNSSESKQNVYNQNFRTAKQQLLTDQKNSKTGQSSSSYGDQYSYGTSRKHLGARRGPGSKFVPPVMNKKDSSNDISKGTSDQTEAATSSSSSCELAKDPRLQNLEPKMIELISNEIMDHGPPVLWEDIAGLEFAKKTIKEIVVWPMLRPDIFTGLRGPPKGLLLFGPPGTGKTLIGKCIASQSRSTFFSISASSLTSKWVGEGEKMVRALFGVAKVHQPAVIFIDEIDSLLSQRSDQEHESSRRIKTEFLVQLDGATTGEDDRILVVGATNRPQEIDEAARRRFVKRLYIPLPEAEARRQIVRHLLKKQSHSLNEQQIDIVCSKTEGYSGADMANLCREAALGPIRRLDLNDIENIRADQVQAIDVNDFLNALRQVKASVSDKDLNLYLDWNQRFGSWDI